MFCFVAGAQGDLPAAEAYEAVFNLIRYAKTLEGFVQAVVPPQQETRKVVLCFDSIESLNNAQWLLSLNGSEERRAGGENNQEHTGCDHRQPGDGEGCGSTAGGG